MNSNIININGVEYISTVNVPPNVGDRVGKPYFIRTVTFAYTGRVVAETADLIVITQAAWIADTGLLTTFAASGDASEVEVYPEDVKIEINKASIVEAWVWPYSLPRHRK